MNRASGTFAPPLRTLEFFVNYACNAKCPFCFNPPDASPELEKGLPFAELARRMYAGFGEGYRGIKFIGGEVTVRDDLPKILGLARKIGFQDIQVTTNGIRMGDARYAKGLVRQGMNRVRFSIHGHTPQLHDRLVQVPGALARVEKAAAALRALDVPMGINYVVNRVNYRDLPETLDWFYGSLGISDVIVYFLRYQGFGALPENKALLKLKMSEAAPYVQHAFKRLKAAGREPLPQLIHFPPCVLPGLEDHILDWTEDPTESGQGNSREDRVTLPDRTGGRIHEVTSSGKRKIAACAKCALDRKCLGVESNYLAEYGEKEFKPLA